MGLNVASEAGNYDAARALANANLEKVLSLPYAEAKIAYKPVNAAVPGTPKSCNTGVYDCEVTTHYVSDSLVDNSAATTKMRVEVTVTWTDGNYTTTGLKAQ